MSGDTSFVNRRVESLIDRAASLGFGPARLAREAGVYLYQLERWRYAAVTPRPEQIVRLRQALIRLQNRQSSTDAMVWSVYRAHLAMQAAACGLDVEETVWADPAQPNSAAWRNGKDARYRAIYLTVTALGVSISEVARCAGITKQAVSKLLQEVEDGRDCPDLDAELDRWDRIMTGGLA